MPKKILLIDNYDSFTYNLYDYIVQNDVICTVMRNDDAQLFEVLAQPWSGVVLSPGPQTPAEAHQLMAVLHFLVENAVPTLGVCLGHEAIGQYFGASLVRAPAPRHGKTSPITHTENGIFYNINLPCTVMRYHSLMLTDVGKTPLIVTAKSLDDHIIMAIKHPDLPIIGIQFHPESIGTPEGLQMIKNWVEAL